MGKREKSKQRIQNEFYEKLIKNEIPATTGINKIIQVYAVSNPDVVLAIIGLKHPAAITVHKYLAKKNQGCFRNTYFNALISRWV